MPPKFTMTERKLSIHVFYVHQLEKSIATHLIKGRQAFDASPEVTGREQQLNRLCQLHILLFIFANVNLIKNETFKCRKQASTYTYFLLLFVLGLTSL